jgi:hypothetical protein
VGARYPRGHEDRHHGEHREAAPHEDERPSSRSGTGCRSPRTGSRRRSTSLKSTDPAHEATWRADLIPWSEHNTEAFAGLHNEGKRIVLLFDEGSAIADKVWEVAEGALTDANTQILWLVFGNGTRPTGRFRECFRKFKHRWDHDQIDSRTVEGINLEQVDKWVADYGEDSDFVKVRVRGMFPSPRRSSSSARRTSTPPSGASSGRVVRVRAEDPDVDPAWTGVDEFVVGCARA